MVSSHDSTIVESESADYDLQEAVFSSFRAEGKVQTTLSGAVDGKGYSLDADVKLRFRVATADEIQNETESAFDIDWDGLKFIRHAQYMVNWKKAEYITIFDYDETSGDIERFGEPVDQVARRLFELEPLNQEPSFLFPRRDPNDGPPPIDDHPGVFITDDIQYQLRALTQNDAFCIDWLSTRELLDHLSLLAKSRSRIIGENLMNRLGGLLHIGGGRPHVEAVEKGIRVAFAHHNNGLSLGVWFPHHPVNIGNIWSLAEELGAHKVSAVEQFPTRFYPQVPPHIWNCFPDPPRHRHEEPSVLKPCLVQFTTGLPKQYSSLD